MVSINKVNHLICHFILELILIVNIKCLLVFVFRAFAGYFAFHTSCLARCLSVLLSLSLAAASSGLSSLCCVSYALISLVHLTILVFFFLFLFQSQLLAFWAFHFVFSIVFLVDFNFLISFIKYIYAHVCIFHFNFGIYFFFSSLF